MKNNHRLLAFLFAVVIAVTAFTGCSSTTAGNTTSPESKVTAENGTSVSQGTEATKKWYDKYEEPITVSVGRGGSTINWPKGVDFVNNAYTNWLKDELGINVALDFFSTDASQYTQRVTLAISSGKLPDIMLVSDQLQLNQLMESGLVADLTEVYEENASPLLKAMVDSYGGPDKAFTTTRYDGHLMAMSDLNPGYQYALTWIRKDWMDKIGAAAPKTMEDVITLAKSFVDADLASNGKTIGIEVQNDGNFAGNYNAAIEMDPVFNYYNAYPRVWYDDGTGNYVYGSTSKETKKVLGDLASMYKSGILAEDFATRDYQASIASGNSGIAFGAWWIASWPLNYTKKNNNDANWQPYTCLVSPEGTYNTYNQAYNTMWAVVNKNCKNPEALIKLLNVSAEAQVSFDGKALSDEETKAYDLRVPDKVLNAYAGQSNLDWGAWPTNLTLRFSDQMLKIATQTSEQLKAYKAGSTDFTEAVSTTLKGITGFESGTDTGAAAWEAYARYKGMNCMLEINDILNIKQVFYPSTTDTMELKWSSLKTLETQSFLKIVMGKEPLDYFDKFVSDWNAQGGKDIAKEVTERAKR